MRVFRLFLLLLGISLAVFLIAAAVSYHRESKRKAERLASVKQTIAELQSSLADESLTPYRRAGLLVQIVNFRNESLVPLLHQSELRDVERLNRESSAEIAKLAHVSLPSDPAGPGEDFIAPSAFLHLPQTSHRSTRCQR